MTARLPWLEAAIHHHAAGRSADAERICNDVLRADSNEADALNLLGLIAAHRGRGAIAANLIGRAIQLKPGRGDFHAALGNVYLMQGMEGAMTECYRRALLLTHFDAMPPPFPELMRHAGAHDKQLPPGIGHYRSQCLQDIYLDRWVFGGMRGGVFLDIGAHDGITFSSSYFFETARGWTGTCVEPNPAVFEKLRAHRTCTALGCCVAGQEGVVPFRKVTGYSEMLSGIERNYHPDHRARVERELKQFGGTSETIPIEARTLPGIAAGNGLSEIHYLSVDTEGSEYEILQSLPAEGLFVHALTVECNIEAERMPLVTLLDAKGFDMTMTLVHDLLFIHRKSPWHAIHAAAIRG
jgi:FkbM family methyltransferase